MARSAAALAVPLLVLCVASTAEAQGRELVDAREAYEAGENDRVVSILQPLVGGIVPAMDDPYLVRDARKYLGAAYALLGRTQDAENQFRYLLNPLPLAELRAQDLDATRFVDTVLSVFRRVRDRLIEEREAEEDDAAAAAAAREARRHAALLQLIEIAQDNELELEVDPLPSFIPFGVGQFTNGDDGLGWFFLISESVLLLTAMGMTATYMALDAHNDSVGTPGSEGRTRFPLSTMYAVAGIDYAAAGGFLILAVAGIIEARISFQPRRRHRIDREVPREVLEDLELAAGPGGVTLRGRFW